MPDKPRTKTTQEALLKKIASNTVRIIAELGELRASVGAMKQHVTEMNKRQKETHEAGQKLRSRVIKMFVASAKLKRSA